MIRINSSKGFADQVKRYESILKYFNIATVALQDRNATLSEWRTIIDILLSVISTKKNQEDYVLFNCSFKPTRVSTSGLHSTNQDFES